MIEAASTVYDELWVSFASLLRSYTSLHGLNRKQQATVELGEDLILVRAGERWIEIVRQAAEVVWTREDGSRGLMRFTMEGRLATQMGDVGKEDREEEMDMQAEAWARELMR